MLKEKPIIFSAPMIRAIKNTRIGQVAPIDPAFPFKGVTRRILKPQPYTPGMLWVREGFCPYDPDHVMDGKRWAYRADVIPGTDSDAARIEYGYKWK